jgi:hypothetical protein
MGLLGLLLVVAGIAVVAVAAMQVRGPLAKIRQLDQTEANLARYESWRGRQTGVQAEGPTGADIMRQQMRQRVQLWAVVAGVGAVLIVLGLIVG